MTDRSIEGVQRLEDLVYRDCDAALAGADAWLAAAEPGGDVVEHQRVRLVRAGARSRQGDLETSEQEMLEINTWARAHGERWLLARSHRMLSSVFHRVGDPAKSLEHAVAGMDLPGDVPEVMRGDHLVILGNGLALVNDYENGSRSYAEALAIFEALGDTFMCLRTLNNMAYLHCVEGNGIEAVAHVERLVAVALRSGTPMDLMTADTIARAYSLVGRFDEAVAALLPWAAGQNVTSSQGDCGDFAVALLTIAEIHRLAGSLDQAQSTLDRVGELTDEYELTALAIDLLKEQAELYAASGQFRQAYETFKSFHAQESALRRREGEERARALHAVYEAAEARRDSDRFRELSLRDPLTGLHNRRFVEEHLPGLLLDTHAAAEPLTVAILDLDHFKAVNDQRSHDVGDAVLVAVAQLLEQAAERIPGAMAARLGGEEFLLVLPGHGARSANTLLEDLRGGIAAHAWDPITAGVPVTISIGAATFPRDGTDRRGLLRCADDRLYDAKRRGRNQVVDRSAVPFG